MRVVVTGGAGFIGTHVCRLLAAHGCDVLAYDNLVTGHPDGLDGAAHLVVADILDTDNLAQAMRGAHAVVHLAALTSVPDSITDPVVFHVVNTGGTVNVLDAARDVGAHVVLASSAAVYGRTEPPSVETQLTDPTSPYGASKVAAEAYLAAYQAAYGLDAVALRLFNVYGPGQCSYPQQSALMPSLCRAAIAAQPLPVHGDGMQARDFVYVGVVANAIAGAVAGRLADPLPVNIGTGRATTIRDVISTLQALWGRELVVAHTPTPRPGDVAASEADVRRMQQLLPWTPYMSLANGLANTLQWWQHGAATRCRT